jgi:hypothetical protein
MSSGILLAQRLGVIGISAILIYSLDKKNYPDRTTRVKEVSLNEFACTWMDNYNQLLAVFGIMHKTIVQVCSYYNRHIPSKQRVGITILPQLGLGRTMYSGEARHAPVAYQIAIVKDIRTI